MDKNNDGPSPQTVSARIAALPEGERCTMYFVAFDCDKSNFDGCKGEVFSARNTSTLQQTLDHILRDKILAEEPLPAKTK